MEAVAHATSADDAQAWRALDRAEAAAERMAREEQPPWPWVFPFDTHKIAHHRLACAVRLRRPGIAYAAGVGPRRSGWAGEDPDVVRGEDRIERVGEPGIPVSEQEFDGGDTVAEVYHPVASGLSGPRTGRVCRYSDVRSSG